MSSSTTEYGEFEGQEAKINTSDNGRRMDIYYGGDGAPDGTGHNHATVINGQIRYLRENGETLIDDAKGICNI